MSNIVLATNDDAFETRTRDAFEGTLNGHLRRLTAEDLQLSPVRAVEIIAGEPGHGPDVVALGPALDVDEALELARRFDQERPEISVVLIAPPTPELWQQALRAGVRDVVDPEAPEDELRATLERAGETAARRRANLAGPGADESGPYGRVITVISPKGGSGKTTVAANLAVGLAETAPDQTVVVDLDLQFGDIASALQLLPEAGIAEAVRARGLDALTLKTYLTNHSTGLYALCAPESPAEGEQVSAEAAAGLIGQLAEEFRYVVVDSSAGITEPTLSALEKSTDVVLVCSMDVPSVRSLRKAIAALDQVGMTSQRRHLVLNRADARVGMSADDVAATVGLPVDVSVPSSRSVPLSLNQGVPLIASDPRSAVAKGLRDLVGRFTEQPAKSGSVLSKLRGAR